jgi:hypothetical protein
MNNSDENATKKEVLKTNNRENIRFKLTAPQFLYLTVM